MEVNFGMTSRLPEMLDWMTVLTSIEVDEAVWSRIKLLPEQVAFASRRFKKRYGVEPVKLIDGRYYLQTKEIAAHFKICVVGHTNLRYLKEELARQNPEANQFLHDLGKLCDIQRQLYYLNGVRLGDSIHWNMDTFGFNVIGMRTYLRLNVLKHVFVVPPFGEDILHIPFGKDVQVLDIRFAENLLATNYLSQKGSKQYSEVLNRLQDFEGDFYKALASVIFNIGSPSREQRHETKVIWFNALWRGEIESLGSDFIDFVGEVSTIFDEEVLETSTKFKVTTLFGREVLRQIPNSRGNRVKRAAFLSVMAGSVLDLWSFSIEELKELGCQPMFFQNTELVVTSAKDLSNYSPGIKFV